MGERLREVAQLAPGAGIVFLREEADIVAEIEESLELHHVDLKAINDAENPDEVSPRTNGTAASFDGQLRVTLKPLSWNVVATRSLRA